MLLPPLRSTLFPHTTLFRSKEMAIGLGPAKGKDFATSLGPIVVTPDELGDLRLEMVARVNGEERSRGNTGDMYHSWDRSVEHTSELQSLTNLVCRLLLEKKK